LKGNVERKMEKKKKASLFVEGKGNTIETTITG